LWSAQLVSKPRTHIFPIITLSLFLGVIIECLVGLDMGLTNFLATFSQMSGWLLLGLGLNGSQHRTHKVFVASFQVFRWSLLNAWCVLTWDAQIFGNIFSSSWWVSTWDSQLFLCSLCIGFGFVHVSKSLVWGVTYQGAHFLVSYYIFHRGNVEIYIYIILILWSNMGKYSIFYNVKQVVNIAK
jgi:hypothetical protein